MLFLQVTFVVLGFLTMIMVQLIENYTTGATAVTGTGVNSCFLRYLIQVIHQNKDRKMQLLYNIAVRNKPTERSEDG